MAEHFDFPLAGRGAFRRSYRLRGKRYVVYPIGPAAPRWVAEGTAEPGFAREFDPARWVLGVAVAEADNAEQPLGFYAVAHQGDPTCYDDTLIFVRPEARGRRLSLLLVFVVYLELLRASLSFRLREAIDHPRLRLHARCGFAPPVRKLVDGKVELGNFDLHTVLSRIESENEIEELLPEPPLH
ncbi:MAG: hypothetical protein IH608_10455 [Proteobacteria bacterium]|nr:hypothetical protein [Pseudomonadota bacterium]